MKKVKILLDSSPYLKYYMQVRDRRLIRPKCAENAMNREIARETEVTFGEYVRKSGG